MALRMAIAFAEIAPAGHHLMVHEKLDHLTLIFTLPTFKAPRGTGLSRKVKSSEPSLGGFGFLHQLGSTHGAHDIKMFRDDERDLQFPFERFLDTSIPRHPSLEDNGGKDFFSSADIIQIISHQRVTEATYNIFNRMSDLLFMNHVCLGKDRAPAGDPDGMIALESKIPKGLNGDPDPGGLFIS